MANILSYTNDKATRTRQDCLGDYERFTIDTINERGGAPILRAVTKDIRTGRTFRIEFSREETADIMRIMLRGGGYGMGELRKKFERPLSVAEA